LPLSRHWTPRYLFGASFASSQLSTSSLLIDRESGLLCGKFFSQVFWFKGILELKKVNADALGEPSE
jgi:hypothetical protein